VLAADMAAEEIVRAVRRRFRCLDEGASRLLRLLLWRLLCLLRLQQLLQNRIHSR
jgi:hypothetical protein